jgi:diadenosine tetraphosphatase ApaH/serine/threonine PP2A family protein phosphatase
LIIESFNQLPICCVINGSFFTVHGGIAPGLKSLNDIGKEIRAV